MVFGGTIPISDEFRTYIRKYVHIYMYISVDTTNSKMSIGAVVSRGADFGRSVVVEALDITTAAGLL